MTRRPTRSDEAVRRAERAYRGTHANACGAGNGSCFVPWCPCECHPHARAAVYRKGGDEYTPPPVAPQALVAPPPTDRVEAVARALHNYALRSWSGLSDAERERLRKQAVRALDAADKAAPPASGLTDRLATALRESAEPIRDMLRHLATLDDAAPVSTYTDAWEAGRRALTTVERALAEYDAQTP